MGDLFRTAEIDCASGLAVDANLVKNGSFEFPLNFGVANNAIAEAGTPGENSWYRMYEAVGSTTPSVKSNTPGRTYTSSFVRDTSSVLGQGRYGVSLSMLHTSGAGEGYGYRFKIPAGFKGNTLQTRIRYKCDDQYTDNAVEVWIFTNSASVTRIQPAPYQIQKSTVATTGVFEWQVPSDATIGYLLLYIRSNATGSTSILYLDDIEISQRAKVFGAPVTDWVSYTPTWTNLTVGNGTQAFYYRRVGDSYQIKGSVVWGSTTSASGNIAFALPNSAAVDTNKLGANFRAGVATAYDTGSTAEREQYGVYRSGSTNTFSILGRTDAGTSGSFNSTFPFSWGSGDELYIEELTVPVVGFSSSTQISDSADTRVVAFKAYRNATLTTFAPNATALPIPLDAVTKDSHGAFNTTSGRYVVLVPGWYDFEGAISLNSTNVLANLYIPAIFRNGSAVAYGTTYNATLNTGFRSTVKYREYLNAGEYIELGMYGNGNNSSSNLSISNGSAETWLSGARSSGPSQIAGVESIALNYNGNPTGTLGTANNKVTYPGKIKDSHGIYSSGVATVPSAGTYSISAGYEITGSMSADTVAICMVFVDTVLKYSGYQKAGGASVTSLSPQVTVFSVPLLAGQQVEIRSYTNAGSPAFTNNTMNFFSMVRTGNY